jgi:hypothetical protein
LFSLGLCAPLHDVNKAQSIFVTALLDIEQDVASLRPKDVYIRETWYPIIARLRRLQRDAANDHTRSQLIKGVFIVWRLQDERGPKHKEKVRQLLLKHLRSTRANVEDTSKT